MKKITSFALGLAFTATYAQNLTSYIPNSADFVGRINSEQVLKQISEDHFNDSKIGKEFFGNISRAHEQANSLSDFGLNFDDGVYVFSEMTDSINHFSLLMGIEDFDVFKTYWSNSLNKQFEYENGVYSLNEKEVTMLIDEDKVLFSFAEAEKDYFKNKPRFEKEMEEDESMYSVYALKRKYQSIWISDYANNIHSKSSKSSITSKKGFKKSVNDKKAAATFWIANYDEFIKSTLGKVYGKYYAMAGFDLSSLNTGFKDISLKLNFNKNNIELSSRVNADKELKKIYKKVSGPKMDKDLWSVFDAENALMYMSVSMSTEGILNEYPNLIDKVYADVFPDYRVEIDLGKAFFNILLDEESIGELITGDVIFAISDVTMKEEKYKSYDYDENYELVEVEKTRQEPKPDFMFLLGSEREDMLEKMLKLGSKYKLVNAENNIYSLKEELDIPFNFYFAVKSGALVVSTNLDNLKNMVSNKKQDLGKHKKAIVNSTYRISLQSEKIIEKLKENGLESQMSNYNDLIDIAGDISITSKRLSCKGLVTNLVIETKGNKENSLILLFDLLNDKMFPTR
ncbi:MAG: hypothetical protein ACPGSD_02355 [Flavobacteriales bacterium]